MCLGAIARAHNEQLKRVYKYKLARRERSWMQQLSLTQVEHLQYEQGIDASNLALANVYTEIQEKHGQMVDAAMKQSQQDWKEYLAKNCFQSSWLSVNIWSTKSPCCSCKSE